MGRVPFRHSSRFGVVKTNSEQDAVPCSRDVELLRECGPGEVGELVVRMPKRRTMLLGAFEGYWEPAHDARAMMSHRLDSRRQYYRTGDCGVLAAVSLRLRLHGDNGCS